MGALRLAWLRVVREPGRTALGVLGVAAIGALLFDMLLLSHGLLISFRDRLDQSGFDVRVTATDGPMFTGPRLEDAGAMATVVAALPSVASVQPLGAGTAEVVGDVADHRVAVLGVDPRAPVLWTMLEGSDLSRADMPLPPVVVNRAAATQFSAPVGSRLSLRGRCTDSAATPLPVAVRVAGIAEFPNQGANALTIAGSLATLSALCGDAGPVRADVLLVRSRPGAGGADAAAAAIRTLSPAWHVVTNEQLVERFSRVEFSYFRQISSVLTTVTLFFGLLLIAVLLTVSVNQRLGEIAGLRALGLTRTRVMAGVFCESALLVGAGGIAAVPVGMVVSRWLDAILRALPGIPVDARFFVFEPRALLLHAALMIVATILAAVYPMRLVAALPIATTLRREVTS